MTGPPISGAIIAQNRSLLENELDALHFRDMLETLRQNDLLEKIVSHSDRRLQNKELLNFLQDVKDENIIRKFLSVLKYVGMDDLAKLISPKPRYVGMYN